MKRHCLLVAVFASMALAGWSGDKEIIVESYSDGLNSEGFSNVDGRWAESETKSTAPGLQASKAVYNDANSEAGVARFSPDIPVAGQYEVFMTYPLQGNASDIKYTVVSSDRTKDTTVTQFGRNDNHTPAPNTWFSLGTYNFTAGKAGYVEVSDPLTGARPLASEPNARIYADAVKFVPVGFELPADYVNKGKTGSTPNTAVAAVSTPAAVVSTPADMPGLPAVQAATTAGSGLPQLPAATPSTVAESGLPVLPSATPAGSALPSLPPSTPATPGLPTLPAATPVVIADAGLPALPAGTPAAAALPSLPAATPASAGLPALPASTPAAAGLPALPPATPAADAGLPSLPAAVTTPIPMPDLPSLAPVTPTPERRMPSPADTPVSGGVSGLPGGPLSNLPPLPGPGMPELPTGPLAIPPAAAVPVPSGMPAMPATMPTTPARVTPAPSPASGMSITQYNPSGLQWMYDFGAALNTARAQNKKVLVFFTATGNKVASTYETDYFNHPAVRQAMSDYVLMKVDFPKNTRLGYSLGIFGAGIIVVTDSVGDVTARIEQQPATPVDLIRLMAENKPLRPAATDDAPVVSVTTRTDVSSAPVDMLAMPSLPQ